MVDRQQLLTGDYKFHILGQHTQTKASTGNKKKLNVTEIATATILARFRQDGNLHETVIPKVPLFLWDAYHCLDNSGNVNNEIFRKSGSTKRITDFFNQNPAMFTRGSTFTGLTQLDVGTLMKDFLRERFEPCFVSADPIINELEQLLKLGVGIEFDAEQNPEFSTLLFVVKVLHSLCLKDASGRITPGNLAVYFTPIFIQESKDNKTLNKTKLARHINLLTGLISKSHLLVVKSTAGSRYRSNSITPGMSLRDEEHRRSSSVIGRIMRYVNKERVPKIMAIPVDSLVSREFTPDGRQSRSRARRTPSSSAKRSMVLTAHNATPREVVEEEQGPSFRETPTSYHLRQSVEKPPKMRDEEKVEYLMEARKRLDFTEPEETPKPPEMSQSPENQRLHLDELLISLQETVEQLSASPLCTPVPCDPSSASPKPATPARVATPMLIAPSPEQVLEEIVKHVAEQEAEMNSICEEFALQDAKLEELKKETKDQGCSPIRFSFSRATNNENSPLADDFFARKPISPKKSSPKKFVPLLQRIVTSPKKVHPKPPPPTWRTNSGGFDGSAAAMIVTSTTQEELEEHYSAASGLNFPLHRPSIALLTKSKQVTRNIARLEEEGQVAAQLNADLRASLRGKPNFVKPTISSGSKSYSKPPDDFKIPTLPKSRSTGSSSFAPRKSLGGSTKFAVPTIPAARSSRLSYSRSMEAKTEHHHQCRSLSTPREAGVPSYAAPTVASTQHARTLHDVAETAEQPPQSPIRPTSSGVGKTETVATLDDVEALISKLSISSFDTVEEQEN